MQEEDEDAGHLYLAFSPPRALHATASRTLASLALLGAGKRVKVARTVASKLLASLSALHREQQVHRGIHLQSVYIRGEGEEVWLADFSVLRETGASLKFHSKADDLFAAGCIREFCAPEFFDAGPRSGAPVDVFAVGVLFSLLATADQVHPFGEHSPGDDIGVFPAAVTELSKAGTLAKTEIPCREALSRALPHDFLAQHFIRQLCHPNPTARLTVDKARLHPALLSTWDQLLYVGEIHDILPPKQNSPLMLDLEQRIDTAVGGTAVDGHRWGNLFPDPDPLDGTGQRTARQAEDNGIKNKTRGYHLLKFARNNCLGHHGTTVVVNKVFNTDKELAAYFQRSVPWLCATVWEFAEANHLNDATTIQAFLLARRRD